MSDLNFGFKCLNFRECDFLPPLRLFFPLLPWVAFWTIHSVLSLSHFFIFLFPPFFLFLAESFVRLRDAVSYKKGESGPIEFEHR